MIQEKLIIEAMKIEFPEFKWLDNNTIAKLIEEVSKDTDRSNILDKINKRAVFPQRYFKVIADKNILAYITGISIKEALMKFQILSDRTSFENDIKEIVIIETTKEEVGVMVL